MTAMAKQQQVREFVAAAVAERDAGGPKVGYPDAGPNSRVQHSGQ